MTLQHRGGARVPGPLGVSPGGVGGRLPGPLAFRHVLVATPGVVARLTKTLKMPPPAADSKTKQARLVTWDLFRKQAPATVDVKQGGLANCPIASILAALAHTESGRQRIQGIVAEHPGAVVTDLSGVAGELDSPPKDNKIVSNRYFSVTLGKTSFEVSDVLYTDDADRNWDPIYMRSPTEALWPCVIEKAFAVREGSYQKIDEEDLANAFWTVLVGSDPEVLLITDKTDLAEIRTAVAAAAKVPTIGASRDDATKVEPWHGYAVMRIQDSTVELYNPYGKTEKISLKDFRSNFKAILRGNP